MDNDRFLDSIYVGLAFGTIVVATIIVLLGIHV